LAEAGESEGAALDIQTFALRNPYTLVLASAAAGWMLAAMSGRTRSGSGAAVDDEMRPDRNAWRSLSEAAT
jgi:hypothetical protein